MDFKEQTYSVLAVSASDKFNTSLMPLFDSFKYSPVRLEKSLEAARRALADREYDFVIINSPLSDGNGVRFAIDVCSAKSAAVLLLVRNELYVETFAKVSRHGVFTLSKPTSRQIMLQGLDWMTASCERLRSLKQTTLSLEDKMREIRAVNRAKWLLITELKMTEADAHRFIEKSAMDRCISKGEFAREIIATYT